MRPTIFLAATLLVATPRLQAQGTQFGFQLGAADAIGDYKGWTQSNIAPALGIHLAIDLGGGHMLRPRLDYTYFKRSVLEGNGGLHFPSTAYYSVDSKTEVTSLMVEYLYHFSRRPEGIYLIAGAGYQHTTFNETGLASRNYDGAALSAGAGWQMNRHVGTELRYVHSTFSTYGYSSFDASTIQGGITFRF